jgi:hypothetical protein
MKFLIVFFLSCYAIFFTFPASAVYFNSIIYDMDPGKSFMAKPVYNDTDRINFYTVSAYKIARPGNGQEASVKEDDKDLIWSPLKVTVQPKGKEYFKLYYRGPDDNTERYYRVIFKETPVTLFPFRATQKHMDVIPIVAMSTILVVRPRNISLKYDIDELNGVIKNTGNTFFRVILQKGCDGDDESSKQFYMLPGEMWSGPEAKASNRKFIVAQDRYHHLGKGCFNTDNIY